MDEKKHHVGLILKSPDAKRVQELLQSYVQRMRQDFLASPAPVGEAESLESASGPAFLIIDKVKTKHSKKQLPLDPALISLPQDRRQMSEFNKDNDWVWASPFAAAQCPTTRTTSSAITSLRLRSKPESAVRAARIASHLSGMA
jgi:hypothetical protein